MLDFIIIVLLMSYICCKENDNQNSMLAYTEKQKLSIMFFYQEWLPTTMLQLWLFIFNSMDTVYLEVIANLNC